MLLVHAAGRVENSLLASQKVLAAGICVSGCDARVITRYGTRAARSLDSK